MVVLTVQCSGGSAFASLWNDGGLGKEKAKENPGRQTNEYYYYILHHTLATSILRGHTTIYFYYIHLIVLFIVAMFNR